MSRSTTAFERYETPGDLLRQGTPAGEIACWRCGAAWDGEGELSARPLCPTHRAETSQWVNTALDIVIAFLERPDAA